MATPAAASATTPAKLKILFIHGYCQNEAAFKSKTGSIRKALKNIAEFSYVSGPHKLPPEALEAMKTRMQVINTPTSSSTSTSDSADPAASTPEAVTKSEDIRLSPAAQALEESNKVLGPRAWWRASDDGKVYTGLEESVEMLAKIWAEQGPFDGVAGFSQGGGVASWMAVLHQEALNNGNPSKFPFMKFVMTIGGFPPRPPEMVAKYQAVAPIKIPSLHVVGLADQMVKPDWSRMLLSFFDKPLLAEHPGGHHVPSSGAMAKHYKDFLAPFQNAAKL